MTDPVSTEGLRRFFAERGWSIEMNEVRPDGGLQPIDPFPDLAAALRSSPDSATPDRADLRAALQEALNLTAGPGNGTVTRQRTIEEWRRLDRLFRDTLASLATPDRADHRYDHDGMHRHHHEYGPTGRAIWWENADQFGGDFTEHTHATPDRADPVSTEGLREAIDVALHELGEPGPGYPAPVANAVDILRAALRSSESDSDR